MRTAEYLKGRIDVRLDANTASHLGKCHRAPIKKRPEPNFLLNGGIIKWLVFLVLTYQEKSV